MDARSEKRPVTVVTGFLGSGKTTLLSRILREPSMTSIAVLVNEFGEVGLDHHLLRRAEEKTVLLGDGCVCCTMRHGLVDALLGLLDEEDRGEVPFLQRVIVETTGLADPGPILHTILSHPVLQHHYAVDLVVVTVDAVNGESHLRGNPESVMQIAAADKVVVTKADIAQPDALRRLVPRLLGINPSAVIEKATFGEIDPQVLFRPAPARAAVRGEDPEVDPPAGDPVDDTAHDPDRPHSISLTFDSSVDWAAFGIWLSMLLHARGEDVMRVKGLLDVGASGPVVLNGVQHIVHPPQHLERWPDADRSSRLVFVSRRVRSDQVLSSLRAFTGLLGAPPRLLRTGPLR